MLKLSEKLELFQELLHCAAPVSFWHYDHDMKLIDSDSPQEQLFDILFTISDCKQNMLEYCLLQELPAVISNQLSMAWLCAPCRAEGILTDIYVIGPVFFTVISENNFNYSISSAPIGIAIKSLAKKAMHDIPVVSNTMLMLYGSWLHYCLTDKHISVSEIQLLSLQSKEIQYDAGSDSHVQKHFPYALEQDILKAVEEGNLNYTHPDNLIQGYNIGKLAENNPLRQVKNEIIVYIALSCRAAIKGGMPEEAAFTLSDYYIQALEAASTVTEVYSYATESVKDYTYRVFKQKQSRYSKDIAECMVYVQMHLDEKISLETLAAAQGYNKNYLATRFKKEVGCTVGDYITREKINRAKSLIKYTAMSISAIGHFLCFSSESHFSSVFRRITGMTPSEYRRGLSQDNENQISE